MRIDCIYLNTCPFFKKKSTSRILICVFYKKKRNVANRPGLYKNKNKKPQHRHTHKNCRFVHVALFTSLTGSPGHRAQQLPLSHAPPQPWTLGTAHGAAAAAAAALLAGSASALRICRRRRWRSRQSLETAARGVAGALGRRRHVLFFYCLFILINSTLRPVWDSYVLKGQLPPCGPAERY